MTRFLSIASIIAVAFAVALVVALNTGGADEDGPGAPNADRAPGRTSRPMPPGGLGPRMGSAERERALAADPTAAPQGGAGEAARPAASDPLAVNARPRVLPAQKERVRQIEDFLEEASVSPAQREQIRKLLREEMATTRAMSATQTPSREALLAVRARTDEAIRVVLGPERAGGFPTAAPSPWSVRPPERLELRGAPRRPAADVERRGALRRETTRPLQ